MLRDAREQYRAKAIGSVPLGEAATVWGDMELVVGIDPAKDGPNAGDDVKAWQDERRAFREQVEREMHERLKSERIAKKREVLLMTSRIPARFALASLFEVPKAFEALPPEDVKRWKHVAYRLRGLTDAIAPWLLHGPWGTGKTALACAAVRMFCEAGRSARYATAREFVAERRDTWGTRLAELAVLDAWSEPDLIVIDEYHEMFPDPRSDGDLVELIDRRYAEQKATLLVTNLTADGFVRAAGAKVDDRLREGVKLECAWDSLRGRLQPEGRAS